MVLWLTEDDLDGAVITLELRGEESIKCETVAEARRIVEERYPDAGYGDYWEGPPGERFGRIYEHDDWFDYETGQQTAVEVGLIRVSIYEDY